MSQPLLNCDQINTGADQPGCESVTEVVKPHVRYLGKSNRLHESHFRIAEVSFPLRVLGNPKSPSFRKCVSDSSENVTSFIGRLRMEGWRQRRLSSKAKNPQK